MFDSNIETESPSRAFSNNKATPSTSKKNTQSEYRMESTLRGVDLNLLTVFDAVMQEQNITRAANNLGMSQPAVSNAVARLKAMYNDELFMRQGRGIQPTQRAYQLFDPVRQALQLIRNELPSSAFVPETSTRQFNLAICAPCDIRFVPKVMSQVSELAPNVHLQLDAKFDQNLAESMRYQETDFVIGYTSFDEQGYTSIEIFEDELVVVASKDHPRIFENVSPEQLMQEKHAKLSAMNGQCNISQQAYKHFNCVTAFQGTSFTNVLHVVAQSDVVTIAPRWLVENAVNRDQLAVHTFPFSDSKVKGYLSWHESSEKDKGHIWLQEQLTDICHTVVATN